MTVKFPVLLAVCSVRNSLTSSKYRYKSEHLKVRTTKCAETIKPCFQRRCQERSFIVKVRLAYYKSDLVAAECVYRQYCWSNTRRKRSISREICCPNKLSEKGRSSDEEQYRVFLRAREHLEDNNEEQAILRDIMRRKENLDRSRNRAYERRHMTGKLLKRFANILFFRMNKGSHI